MTRSHMSALAVLAVVGVAPAQPPRPAVPFKPFGGGQATEFYQSSVTRWADQLAQELADARAAVRVAPIRPDARRDLSDRAARTADAAAEVARVARRGGDRRAVGRAFDALEREAAGLTDAVRRTDGIGPVFAGTTYAYQQLAAAVGEGQADPGVNRRGIARLAQALDHQADDLIDAADRTVGTLPRDLDRAVHRFGRAARRLHRGLDDGGTAEAAAADFRAVQAGWADVLTGFGRVPTLPQELRTEINQTDGLYRRLAARMGGVNPGPLPPPGPIPPPVLPPVRTAAVAVGASDGGGPRVVLFHDLRGNPALNFFAYDPAFRGGVRVAVADTNGDGVADVVTGPGSGMGPLVRVFDGRDGALLAEFVGHDPGWQGGVTVAAAGLGRDGRSLVAVGCQTGGGPVVKVFDLVAGREVLSFAAYPAAHRGGARVAFLDVDGDGLPEIATAPGACDLGPLVRVFNLSEQRLLAEFLAFDPGWRGGVWVAGDGRRVVCGPDGGGGPDVRVYDVAEPQRPRFARLAFAGGFRGGVRVGAGDVDGDGVRDLLCAAGNGLKDSPIEVYSGKDGRRLVSRAAFPGFDGGGFIAGP